MDDLRAGRELDAACAGALGWRESRINVPGGGYIPHWYDANNAVSLWGGAALGMLPPFSSYAPAARLLEDEIERRGLEPEYVFALAELLFVAGDEWGTAHVMKMMRATPEQRARAFLKAVGNA